MRAYSVRKQDVIPTLKKLAQVQSTVTRTIERFTNQQSSEAIRGDARRHSLLGHEEDLTKALITLDGISVKNSDYLRERRREIVRQINDRLQWLDSQKPEVFAKAKEEQNEINLEREEKRRLAELEAQKQAELQRLAELAAQQSADGELDDSEEESSECFKRLACILGYPRGDQALLEPF